MKALPTITASAPAPIISLICPGFDMPNPTATGKLPASFFVSLIRLVSSAGSSFLSPVTPVTETRYRNPDAALILFLSRSFVVVGAAKRIRVYAVFLAGFFQFFRFFDWHVRYYQSGYSRVSAVFREFFQASLEHQVIVCHAYLRRPAYFFCCFEVFVRIDSSFQSPLPGFLYHRSVCDRIGERQAQLQYVDSVLDEGVSNFDCVFCCRVA